MIVKFLDFPYGRHGNLNLIFLTTLVEDHSSIIPVKFSQNLYVFKRKSNLEKEFIPDANHATQVI